jgi:hypothetical protein
MKVENLIELLSKLPPDMDVILQKDEEGNGYTSLEYVDPNCIFIECDGDMYSTDWTADDCCLEEHEWELMKQENPKCVVLSP